MIKYLVGVCCVKLHLVGIVQLCCIMRYCVHYDDDIAVFKCCYYDVLVCAYILDYVHGLAVVYHVHVCVCVFVLCVIYRYFNSLSFAVVMLWLRCLQCCCSMQYCV